MQSRFSNFWDYFYPTHQQRLDKIGYPANLIPEQYNDYIHWIIMTHPVYMHSDVPGVIDIQTLDKAWQEHPEKKNKKHILSENKFHLHDKQEMPLLKQAIENFIQRQESIYAASPEEATNRYIVNHAKELEIAKNEFKKAQLMALIQYHRQKILYLKGTAVAEGVDVDKKEIEELDNKLKLLQIQFEIRCTEDIDLLNNTLIRLTEQPIQNEVVTEETVYLINKIELKRIQAQILSAFDPQSIQKILYQLIDQPMQTYEVREQIQKLQGRLALKHKLVTRKNTPPCLYFFSQNDLNRKPAVGLMAIAEKQVPVWGNHNKPPKISLPGLRKIEE